MSKFDLVDTLYSDLRYMTHAKAKILREVMLEEDARTILEIGFAQGKSSAYIAAVLEDQGEGSLLTIDMQSATRQSPNIEDVLEKLGLSHRVTPLYCKRSYTWELQRLINAPETPQFDLCFFDGGHTWDSTGFGVVLVDMLLRPGGVMILNDLDWSIGRSPYFKNKPKAMAKYDDDEIASEPVRLVRDTILGKLGYENIRPQDEIMFGVSRKPF